ncbi:pilus assembly protein TadG-related protein [Aquibium microcysteis]|uniref:pilus assembly protein TadG-related protein n=1 Tax=Aquibium microcysteis TaxID=675281 RepID=UPI00165D2E79|nr:pilus assembly protein TadG-related protein [Aquibium microcysteis]
MVTLVGPMGRVLKRFAADASGNMLVLSALSMPVVIGCAGLAVEYGSAVGLRAQNQRMSDLAAYAGAVAYAREQSEERMRAAALAVVALNGGDPQQAEVSLVASPLDPDALAVRVDVAGVQPAFLSAILSDVIAIPVLAGSTAILGSPAREEGGGCIVALDAAQSGITLSGGTTLNAPDCAIASNAAVVVPCGTRVSALKVTYGSTLDNCRWDTNVRETVARQSVTDPLAGHTGIAAAWARVASVNAMQWPPVPSVKSGTDVHFEGGWNQTTVAAVKAKMPIGCSAAWNAPRWTVDCSGVSSGQEIRFGNITVAGGVTLDVDPNGKGRTYYVNGGIETGSSGEFRFGGGNWTIRQGLRVQGSASVTFGAGSFLIGNGKFTCGGSQPSICVQGSGSLVFGDASMFNLGYGLRIEGSTRVELGGGSGNAYHIGNSGGTAVALEGSSRLRTGDVSAADGFRIKGDVKTAGGSCAWFGRAAHSDVDGQMSLSGGSRLGAGTWTVNGGFQLGASGGGGVTCFGQEVSLLGQDVTLVVSGKGVKSSGSCGDAAFCATAGYRNVTLSAPTTGANANVALIGPQTSATTTGASFAAGAASARISGAFYFPNGPLEMSGGAGVGGGTGGCFQVVASRVTLTGGTTGASNCEMSAESGGAQETVAVRIVR